jgi:hypothetical protein
MLNPVLLLLTANATPPASLNHVVIAKEEDASFIKSQERAAKDKENSLVKAMASNSFTDKQLNNIKIMINPREGSTPTFPQTLNEFITMLVQLPGRTNTESSTHKCPQASCPYTTSRKDLILKHLDANRSSYTIMTIAKLFIC